MSKTGKEKFMRHPETGEGFYPATLTTAVYFEGTSMTLQDWIDNGGLLTGDKLKEQLDQFAAADLGKLERFRGEMTDALYVDYKTKQAFRDSCIKGDWWVYRGEELLNFDAQAVVLQNGIVWFDGEYFQSIYVPYQNSTKPQPYYDAVIIGAGAGGIGAAYALRNSGWRVALVERLDTLGGTHCQGVGLYIPSPACPWMKTFMREYYDLGLMGFSPRYQKPLYGVGTGDEFDKKYRASQFNDPREGGATNPPADAANSFPGNYLTNCDFKLSRKYHVDFENQGIDIFINTEVIKTNSEYGKVFSVMTRNLISGVEYEICGDYFLDCSGDGVLFTNDVNLVLDTDYYVGEDPAARFNEVGNGMYASGFVGNHYGVNVMEPMIYRAGRINGYVAEFPPFPTNLKPFPGLTNKNNFTYNPLGGSNGVGSLSVSYATRMTGKNFLEKSNEWNWGDAYERGRTQFYTKGSYSAGARFAGIRRLLAIREKYRINAVRNYTAQDLLTQITSQNYASEHVIALSTWFPDIHNDTQNYGPPYTIANGVPYESMIPKAYTNVLVACKAAGFSHLALSSVRLVKTIMDMGHSAGRAILQLLNNTPAETERGDVRTVDITALQSDIRIAETVTELETYFYGSTVDYEEYPVT